MRTTLAAALCLAACPGVAAASDGRLVDAAKRQDVSTVRTLLQQGMDPNAPAPDGSTALHWAAYRDDGGVADVLIRAGARVDVVTDLGVTPLSLACTNGSDSMVLRLLTAGADANRALPTGESPLMTCSRSGSTAAVKALIASGAKLDAGEQGRGQTALMWAVAARQPQVVQALVEAGADVNARSTVTSQWVYTGFRYITSPPANPTGIVVEAKEGGFTPLLFAAQQGDLESARLLTAAGARLADADAAGTSPLVMAAHSGHGKVAAFLLTRGADPNDDEAGYTALHAAVLRGDLELVEALLAKGADPNARLTKGTPVRKYSLDYALSSAWLGATPYWLAGRFGEPAIMRALASAGADTRLPAEDGTTPLVAAISTSQGDRRERFQTEAEIAARPPVEDARVTLEVARVALDLGANINATSRSGDTAVHAAAARGLNDVIQLLAERGADLSVKNKRGLTPLALVTSMRRVTDFFGDGTTPQAFDPGQSPTAVLLRKLGATE